MLSRVFRRGDSFTCSVVNRECPSKKELLHMSKHRNLSKESEGPREVSRPIRLPLAVLGVFVDTDETFILRRCLQVKRVVGRVMYESLCQAGKRGYSAWVVEIHEKEHPQCRKPRRSRVYRMRSG